MKKLFVVCVLWLGLFFLAKTLLWVRWDAQWDALSPETKLNEVKIDEIDTDWIDKNQLWAQINESDNNGSSPDGDMQWEAIAQEVSTVIDDELDEVEVDVVELDAIEVGAVELKNEPEPEHTDEAADEIFNYPSIRLNDIAFFPQAPEWNRDQPWQDACEEASLVLAAYGISGDHLNEEIFKDDILKMISVQEEMFGSAKDTTLAQTKQLYDEFYGIWSSVIIDNPEIQEMKQTLSEWKLIVAPFAGKLLGNIYFSNDGPRYHMLTIIGYDQNWFITHDVGTKRGAQYRYSDEVLMNALHDFVPENQGDIQQGKKTMLVIWD